MSEFTPIVDTPEIQEQIAKILASNSFRRRRKLLGLFEFLVAETIAGRAPQLTQRKIAAEVFGLEDSLSPDSDVNVRISASRLRDLLDEYYRKEAQPDEVRIYMPPRSYYIAAETTTRIGRERRNVRGLSLGKKISQSDIIGKQGINFIEKLCLEMGFLWHPTGLEAGIDGYIEIRHESGEMTNCIIQVQSKATDRPFEAETPSTLEFRCATKDLDYWLAGNAPVILVRSRPRTKEAYWISVKDYFSDLTKRKTAKIIFDKDRDKFDLSAKVALQRFAIHKDTGLYLGTRPKTEIIYSNLLELSWLPKKYFVGETEYRTRGEIFAALREMGTNVHGEWILNSKMLTSFHDLSRVPWLKVCDRGTVEALDTDEWAETNDPVRQRQFVQLLNSCLREKLYRKGIKFSHENRCYYFRAPKDLSEREYTYQSREHRTSRLVFRGYPDKRDHTRMSYYRHSAFQGRFIRYGSTWYLQITPTYCFTRDGERTSRYAADLLSGIKRLETNAAVHGQVVMWGYLLTERSLFDTEPQFINFNALLDFELDVGLDDDAWLKHEDDPEKRATFQSLMDDRQRSLII